MRAVRRGIFETNSSSMHSIVVTNQDSVLEKELRREGHYFGLNNLLSFYLSDDMDFGRYPFEILVSFKDKLRYAFASLLPYDDAESSDIYKELIEIAKDYYDCSGVEFPKEAKSAYFDSVTGEEVSLFSIDKFDDSVGYYAYTKKDGSKGYADKCIVQVNCYGSVDHQSSGMLARFLEVEGVSVKEFLENSKYIVIIDGDEYGYWEKYKNSGLIRTDIIVKEFPENPPFA